MIMSKDKFVNPYTFVPLPTNGKRVADSYSDDEPLLTGEIKCRLITKTQIAVPDIAQGNEYKFFEVDGNAIIPGSGLRGVIRNTFEALTDSCLRINDSEDDYFTSRCNKNTPGLIERRGGKYILYTAERFRDKTSSVHKTGDVVEFEYADGQGRATRIVTEFIEKSNQNSKSGYYLKVNKFGKSQKQSNPSVFVKTNNGIEIDKVYIDRLEQNIKLYEEKDKGVKEAYLTCFNGMKKEEKTLPVWYWKDISNGHYYFAPSQCSRAVYINKPKDLLKSANMEACVSKKCACEACSLFGFIQSGDDGDCCASKVRFTDAICIDKNCFDKSYVLPILSTPRLSSFEFYLDSNNNKYGADTKGVKLAGRKFYWHHKNNPIIADDEKAVKTPNMSCKMQLVKPNSTFSFSVFFNNITHSQLSKLIFSLNFGENESSSVFCHKIGHGKPIGLGSVKIVVDSINTRTYSKYDYCITDNTDLIDFADKSIFNKTDERIINAVLKVADMNTISEEICYPCENKGEDIFKWFANNRDDVRAVGYLTVKQKLPKITDKRNTLDRKAVNNSTSNNSYPRNKR